MSTVTKNDEVYTIELNETELAVLYTVLGAVRGTDNSPRPLMTELKTNIEGVEFRRLKMPTPLEVGKDRINFYSYAPEIS